MDKNIITQLKKIDKKMNAILDRDGFTSEVENLIYVIGEFCIKNDINVATYKALISD